MIAVKLVRAVVRFLMWLFPVLSADHRRRIKPRSKCPACGAVKRHKIEFDPSEKKVVLTCAVCTCAWAYDPIVKPERYLAPPREDES